MTPVVWSWITAGVSVGGLGVAGINPRAGWVYGLGAQGVWAAYGVTTRQYGMVAGAVVFDLLYCLNLWRWRGTRFQRHASRQAIPEQHPVGSIPSR